MEYLGSEKRRFPRAAFPCKILISLPQEHTLVTHTENLGFGGVKVIVEEDLKVSSSVGLEVFIGFSKSINCKGKIVWALEVKNPLSKDIILHEIGIEFIDLSDVDKDKICQLMESIIEESDAGENRLP